MVKQQGLVVAKHPEKLILKGSNIILSCSSIKSQFTGKLEVLGETTIQENLFVGKTAVIKNAASVEGILDVTGDVTLDSTPRVGKRAIIAGYTSLESKLNVKKQLLLILRCM